MEQMPQEAEKPAVAMDEVIGLAQDVGQGLAKLSQMMSQSQASDEDKAQMSQIMEMFVNLVEKSVGEGGGVEKAPQPVSMQQGPNGVPMGPQSRM